MPRRQKWSFDPHERPLKRGGSALTDGCGYRRCFWRPSELPFIYSAASVHGLGDITYWYQHPFVRQIAALLLGLGIAVALCAFDYHVIARWSMVCYWLSLLLLLIVFLCEPR